MKSHHTQDKGDLGVIKAKLDLLNKGYTILKPEAEHALFDIVAYKKEKFIRVQVKYRASRNNTLRLKFATSWTNKKGTHSQPYDKDEVDVICTYCPDTDRCYYVDLKEFGKGVYLRLSPPKSAQKARINMADNYVSIPRRFNQ